MLSNNRLSTRLTWAVAALALAVALALRIYSLGEWSFSGDEVPTIWEERALFHGAQESRDSQTYRLPHAIPLGYLFVHLSHSIFGDDEHGTRVVLAVLGALGVVATFLLLKPCMPASVTLATTILVALWPHHVFRSQETRFYIVAALFAFCSLLLGGLALKRNSAGVVSIALMCALAATLSHTLMLVLFPILFACIFSGYLADRKFMPASVFLVFAGFAALLAGAYLVYLQPLLGGWNAGETWGYGVVHAALASIVMIGWPTAVLAAFGGLIMMNESGGQNWYWIVGFVSWVLATIFLPVIVSYHSAYVFPLALPAMVLAGKGIGTVYEKLKGESHITAAIGLGLLCLLNLPSLVSHFVDGSRWDMRRAANFVRERWAAGDSVAGLSMGTFGYYSRGCCAPRVPLGSDLVPELQRLAREGRRTWIILETGRGGLGADAEQWLFECAHHRASISRRRFDDAEYVVEIFLISPPADRECGAGAS